MDWIGSISGLSATVVRAIVSAVILLCASVGQANPAAGALAVEPISYGIGVSGGVAGHTGFAFRYYLGEGYLQASGVALMLDQGNFIATSAGLDYGHYLAMTRPRINLLRGLTVGLAYRGQPPEDDSDGLIDARDVAVGASQSSTTNNPVWSRLLSVSAGIGVDLGKVRSPGMTVAVDVRMSLLYDEKGFFALIYLPYGALIYNW
jgi:hypothetical protein